MSCHRVGFIQYDNLKRWTWCATKNKKFVYTVFAKIWAVGKVWPMLNLGSCTILTHREKMNFCLHFFLVSKLISNLCERNLKLFTFRIYNLCAKRSIKLICRNWCILTPVSVLKRLGLQKFLLYLAQPS